MATNSNAFWHPFANMGLVKERELVLVRGEGCHVEDSDGRRYIDAAAGLWYCNVGHGRESIAEAMAAQAKVLAACSCFEDVCDQPARELAARIAALAPFEPEPKVFFTSGGSDAVDSAAKMARAYWAARGRPEKLALISRQGCYHGAHAMGTSLAGIPANREGFGPLVRETANVARFDAAALADKIDELGADNVAAFFAEPVINAGVWAPPGDYLKEAREVCRERDVLFVADEVVTGFGRIGDWFASARFGIDPDLLLFAKGVTSGYLPLGGVIASAAVAEPFWSSPDGPMLRHGYTYSGHATACAAALANLDIMEAERLPQRAAEIEDRFAATIGALADIDGVQTVRSAGLAAAVQLEPELTAADPSLPRRAILAAREHGVLSRMLSGFAFQISPPLTITEQEIREVADGIAAAVADALAPEAVAS